MAFFDAELIKSLFSTQKVVKNFSHLKIIVYKKKLQLKFLKRIFIYKIVGNVLKNLAKDVRAGRKIRCIVG
jgi:hypothetical protein